ncbi:hypothetical protein KSP39_PZI004216 [Platanthera zijinensis]|uniref:Uncharacterized protein n=1 Tax=Platanthera zijinensis TaxID=2320716 RepID=A0AAP0GCN6_9ASPA
MSKFGDAAVRRRGMAVGQITTDGTTTGRSGSKVTGKGGGAGAGGTDVGMMAVASGVGVSGVMTCRNGGDSNRSEICWVGTPAGGLALAVARGGSEIGGVAAGLGCGGGILLEPPAVGGCVPEEWKECQRSVAKV